MVRLISLPTTYQSVPKAFFTRRNNPITPQPFWYYQGEIFFGPQIRFKFSTHRIFYKHFIRAFVESATRPLRERNCYGATRLRATPWLRVGPRSVVNRQFYINWLLCFISLATLTFKRGRLNFDDTFQSVPL